MSEDDLKAEIVRLQHEIEYLKSDFTLPAVRNSILRLAQDIMSDADPKRLEYLVRTIIAADRALR